MIYQKIWSCSNQTHIKVWTLYTNNCSFMYVWEIEQLAYEVFPILNQELSKPWANMKIMVTSEMWTRDNGQWTQNINI